MLRFAAVAVLAASPLAAQELRDCPAISVEDVNEYRTFANGAIYFEVFGIDAPNCCTLALAVRHPAPEGAPTCHALYWDGDLGYAQINLSEASASYDPARGLTVDVSALFVMPDLSFQNATLLSVTVNQGTGTVSVTQQLGNN